MVSSENMAGLAARLHELANNISIGPNSDPREECRTAVRKAAMEVEQAIVKSHSRDDSYVLVLVDAHSHPFNDEIFYRSTDQSYPALDPDKPFNIKERLYEAIRKHMIDLSSDFSPATLGTSRIVVRVYANTTKLENDLLCPLQKFAVQFSSVDPDFDFFGVGDETMVELKVIDAFQSTRKDPDCKHVFFAAWRRPVYISMLQIPSENVTLIQGYDMGAGAGLVSLSCGVISIPDVFNKPAEKDLFLSLTSRSTQKCMIATPVIDRESCRDGQCGLPHATTSPDEICQTISSGSPTYSLRQPGCLPQARDAIPHHVPVNAKGERLDYYTQRPSRSDWQAYIQRFGKDVRPCQWFHLTGACHFQEGCCYDHSPISAQVMKAFRYMVKKTPCTKGSRCPLIDCMYGHVCQEPNCITEDLESCSLRRFHGVNTAFASWKKGKHAPEFPTAGPLHMPEEHVEEASTESFWF